MDLLEWAAWKPHHRAWLLSHPWWTPEWFKERLREGFDVHHLDGDHSNNDPLNLVLIEHSDHMMIHGGRTMGRMSSAGKRRKKTRKQRANDRYEKMKRDLVASLNEDLQKGL